jgi:hypothetical protein
MQVQQSRRVLSNLSNALPPGLDCSRSSLDDEDPEQLQLFVGAAGLQLLQFVRKSKSKSKSYSQTLADEKQRKRNRVNFRLDEDNCLLAETYDCPVNLTDDECQALWWSSEELLAIHLSASLICDYLRESEQEYCHAAASLVGMCARSDTSESSLPATNPVLTCVQHGAARGLNFLIVPTLPIRRKRSIQLVLQFQADQREQVHWDHMLAAKYQYWSRYATIWARVLAEQDAACCQPDDLNIET